MEKSESTLVEPIINTLDEAVKYLEECREKGKNVYLNFNGHKLYSANVTIDSAYMQVMGITKAEDDAISKEVASAHTLNERTQAINKYTTLANEHKEQAKTTAVPADAKYFNTLDDAVAYLNACNRDGQNVYIDFNGHKLYSADVTIDSAYMEVVGLTKEQADAMDKEVAEASTPEERHNIIMKWENMKNAPQDVLKSAIEATEKTTTISSIDEQEQAINELSITKEKQIEGMEKK